MVLEIVHLIDEYMIKKWICFLDYFSVYFGVYLSSLFKGAAFM